MRLIEDLFGNLLSYNHPDLESVEINGRRYKTLVPDDIEPNVVFAQAFGASYDENSYNRVLAETILDLKNCFEESVGRELTTIVQTEVGYCLERINSREGFYPIGKIYKNGETSKLKSKVDTYWMLKKTQELLKGVGLENDLGIFVVGHPAHMHRILKIAEKMGFKPIPIIPFMSENSWFPKNDPQLWVRSKYFWVPREIATRLHHKIKGIM